MPTLTLTLPSLVAPTEPASGRGSLICHPIPFERIPRAAWDRLVAATPFATPFCAWNFHRAWWDAYGTTAHEQYIVCLPAGAAPAADVGDAAVIDDLEDADIRAIFPLMHRHQAEPEDAQTATILRHHGPVGTMVPDDAKAIFFGASYHADYATALCAPDDLAAATQALAKSLAGPTDSSHGDTPWDVVDLRRLRAADPALPALERALVEVSSRRGWRVIREPEDVCPVVTVPDGGWESYIAGLGKKSRHEIRRKLRRAESAGGLEIDVAPATRESVDAFIDLHQARFGHEGLFPPTEGGARSRRFIQRLTELEAAEPGGGQLQVGLVRRGERLIFAALAFDDGQTCFLYNAGMDPDASDLSPGITGTAEYLRDRISAGRTRFDFLRGDEAYKYEWGAVDEVIERLLMVREATT